MHHMPFKITVNTFAKRQLFEAGRAGSFLRLKIFRVAHVAKRRFINLELAAAANTLWHCRKEQYFSYNIIFHILKREASSSKKTEASLYALITSVAHRLKLLIILPS